MKIITNATLHFAAVNPKMKMKLTTLPLPFPHHSVATLLLLAIYLLLLPLSEAAVAAGKVAEADMIPATSSETGAAAAATTIPQPLPVSTPMSEGLLPVAADARTSAKAVSAISNVISTSSYKDEFKDNPFDDTIFGDHLYPGKPEGI